MKREKLREKAKEYKEKLLALMPDNKDDFDCQHKMLLYAISNCNTVMDNEGELTMEQDHLKLGFVQGIHFAYTEWLDLQSKKAE